MMHCRCPKKKNRFCPNFFTLVMVIAPFCPFACTDMVRLVQSLLISKLTLYKEVFDLSKNNCANQFSFFEVCKKVPQSVIDF